MKKNFLTGLVIILPLALTFIIVLLIVDLLTQPFLGFTERLLQSSPLIQNGSSMFSSEQAVRLWSQIIILVTLFLFVFVLGFFARWFIFKMFVKWGDYLIHRIPIINKLYKTFKEVINVIFTSQDKAFKQVVMVAFPNEHTFCLGFLSKESPNIFNKPSNQDLIAVFLPTTPNPTTGYLLQFPKSEVKHLDMTIEDALKFIVSCGMVSDTTLGHKKIAGETE